MRVPVLVLVISLVATGGVLGEVRVGPGASASSRRANR